MPYPAKIDYDTLVTTAADLIEQHGIEWLSLAKLASVLGVKAPSLYRHVANKNELLRAVNLRTSEALITTIRQAAEDAPNDPAARLMAVARAYRDFARDHPAIYRLAFTSASDDLRPDEADLEALVLPLQVMVAAISGEADSLAALRGLWALLHGFALLEMSRQMRREGALNDAFNRAITAYLQGWRS